MYITFTFVSIRPPLHRVYNIYCCVNTISTTSCILHLQLCQYDPYYIVYKTFTVVSIQPHTTLCILHLQLCQYDLYYIVYITFTVVSIRSLLHHVYNISSCVNTTPITSCGTRLAVITRWPSTTTGPTSRLCTLATITRGECFT